MSDCKATKDLGDCHFCASQHTDGCVDMIPKIELDGNISADDFNNFLNTAMKSPFREVRTFSSGAVRDGLEGKLDYEGFLSPLVLERYAQYLDHHRVQADGNLRDSDNWQGGMPRSVYMKSLMRHVLDAWKEHRGYGSREGLEDALCGVIFNAMGYLFEILHNRSIDE